MTKRLKRRCEGWVIDGKTGNKKRLGPKKCSKNPAYHLSLFFIMPNRNRGMSNKHPNIKQAPLHPNFPKNYPGSLNFKPPIFTYSFSNLRGQAGSFSSVTKLFSSKAFKAMPSGLASWIWDSSRSWHVSPQIGWEPSIALPRVAWSVEDKRKHLRDRLTTGRCRRHHAALCRRLEENLLMHVVPQKIFAIHESTTISVRTIAKDMCANTSRILQLKGLTSRTPLIAYDVII